MFKKILIAICLFFVTLAVVHSSVVFADSSPAAEFQAEEHISNVVDRLVERITLFFKFSPEAKWQYQKELVDKRLGELKYAVGNDRGDLVEELGSRYSTYLGNFVDMTISNKMVNKKQEVADILKKHAAVVSTLDSGYEANSGLWLVIQHDKNYIKIYSDQLGQLN